MSDVVRKAVLLAAGRGTRMRELTNELPKPMIEVRGKPILQHIVEGLRDAGVTHFLIVVGYRADVVQEGFTVEKKGRIVRPNTKPGLGITINEKAVKKHPFQQEIVLREFSRDGAVADW